jgi:hypothetical protein
VTCKTYRRAVAVALGAVLFAAAGTASGAGPAAKPNFSGSWRLNAAKSDFGPLPPPRRFDRVIRHDDPAIEIQTTQSSPQGDVSSSVKHRTDGSQSVNAANGRTVRSVLKWQGKALVIESTAAIPGVGEIKTVENWTLQENGNVLVTDSAVSAPQGQLQIHLVLDRAGSSGR